ncbi:MAG: hypothetical protein U0175_25835 [Caldilineaceae bacterium]
MNNLVRALKKHERAYHRLLYTLTLVKMIGVSIVLLVVMNTSLPIRAQNESSSVTPVKNIVQVSAGGDVTCVLTHNSGVRCAGMDMTGYMAGYFPFLADVSGFEQTPTFLLAGAGRACVALKGFGAQCWGSNFAGALGVPSIDIIQGYAVTPTRVISLTEKILKIANSGNHTCALTEQGVVKCWGDNQLGELGDGTTTNSLFPVTVVNLTEEVIDIASGQVHSCVVLKSGGVKCWGGSYQGQVGGNSYPFRTTPIDVPDLASGVQSVVGGGYHTCALTTIGTVKCWGGGNQGQLGNGSSGDSTIPVTVTGITSTVIAISAGSGHTCALDNVGKIWCWGSNEWGQVGVKELETYFNTPVEVQGLAGKAISISCGYGHTCALFEDSTVMCWGNNSSGQLGDGSINRRGTPAVMVELPINYLPLMMTGAANEVK